MSIHYSKYFCEIYKLLLLGGLNYWHLEEILCYERHWPSLCFLHSNSSTTSVCPTKVWTGAVWLAIFHSRRLFSPLRNCGTTTVIKPSPNGCKDRHNIYTQWFSNIIINVKRISKLHNIDLHMSNFIYNSVLHLGLTTDTPDTLCFNEWFQHILNV